MDTLTPEQEKVKVILHSLRELALSAHYQKKLRYYAHLTDAALMLEAAYLMPEATPSTEKADVTLPDEPRDANARAHDG